MISDQQNRSDGIRRARGTDISKLARELEIDPGALEAVLDNIDRLLRASPENVRPADKKALRGVAKTLAQTIHRLSSDKVRERLQEAVFREPDGPDEEGLAHYTAWCAARTRVDDAIEGALDLLALVHAGEEFEIPAGRRPYVQWTVAIGFLLEFWTDDLGREVTISGHAADPRGGQPSWALRFVHQCMQSLDEKITEQACRTILQKLRNQKIANTRTTP